MQCMSAFLGGCPASMLRVASQWAIPAEPEIFSQIVICLFLHADICDITFFFGEIFFSMLPGVANVNPGYFSHQTQRHKDEIYPFCFSVLILSDLSFVDVVLLEVLIAS